METNSTTTANRRRGGHGAVVKLLAFKERLGNYLVWLSDGTLLMGISPVVRTEAYRVGDKLLQEVETEHNKTATAISGRDYV